MANSSAPRPGVLTAAVIRQLLEVDPPLVGDLADSALQVQPSGVDLRLESVWQLEQAGHLGREERSLPPSTQLAFDASGWLHLRAGTYLVRLWEVVNLPLDIMALGRPRSSLLRLGCSLHTAVWDAGFRGRSETLLTVANPAGFWVERGTRILQLVFFRLAEQTERYAGAY